MKSVTPMDVVDEVVDEVEEEDEEDGEEGVDDDIFGSSGHSQRGGGGGGSLYLARARPTMISAKYRLKEERRKVLKISVAKLKRIDDPESSLRRSVLINNTVRRLQREARDEKMQRQQSISHVSPYHHLLRPLIAPSHDSPSANSDDDVSKDHSSHLDAPDIALSLPDLSDALVDDDPNQLPPRLSVESLEEGLDASDSISSSPSVDPACPVLIRPSSRVQDTSDTDDDSTPSSSPPYIGFDSMETSFAAETETSDVFSAPSKSILDGGSRGPLDNVQLPASSATADSSDSRTTLCYEVTSESEGKLSGGCGSVVSVTCSAMTSVRSMCSVDEEEEREACGALVNCLDELVEATGMCRTEEEMDGTGACKVQRCNGGAGSEEEEDEEVEDVHSVLSQFYMPPTPRMLTSIDDEEEEQEAAAAAAVREALEEDVAAAVEAAVQAADATRSVDAGEAMVIASARQCGLPEPSLDVVSVEESESNSRKRPYECTDDSLLMMDEFSEEMVLLEKENAKRQRLSGESRQSARKQSQSRPRRVRNSPLRDGDTDSENSQTTQFSCGHASIFGELQSVVFHSLIASLES